MRWAPGVKTTEVARDQRLERRQEVARRARQGPVLRGAARPFRCVRGRRRASVAVGSPSTASQLSL